MIIFCIIVISIVIGLFGYIMCKAAGDAEKHNNKLNLKETNKFGGN